MSALIVVLVVIAAAAIIGFALYKKDYVRASISLRPFGFFLEAGNHERVNRKGPSDS